LGIVGTNLYLLTEWSVFQYTTTGTSLNQNLIDSSGPPFMNMVTLAPSVNSLSPPNVSITTISNQPVILWPANGGNYVLQTTTNIASGNWVRVSNYVPMTGAVVTNATSPAFFRLQIPGQ
jgi:hypothetical protein